MKISAFLAIFPLLLCTLPACTDTLDVPDTAGEVKYRFMAEIDGDNPSRVAIEPFDHGHDSGNYPDLTLHWEEGDVVEVEADGSGTVFEFVAHKYVCRDGGAVEPFTASTVLDDGDEEVIFFEYSGSGVIDNASSFSGTATCRPQPLDTGAQLTQELPGSALHLRHCELMTARLENVDLATPTSSWTGSDVQKPIIFDHSADCAYLKIETTGFRYTVGGGGEIFVYDLDEESDNEAYRCQEYFTPLASMRFGDGGQEFIKVPAKGDAGHPNSEFDTYTNHYLRASEIGCDFYVPLPPTTVKAGHYLAVVVKCGSSGDLYVFEKKVPIEMDLRAGYLYTLNYGDRQPEYALCVTDNLTFIRSTYLGQDFEGKGATAPRYDMKGSEISLTSASPHHGNRFSEQDAARCGDDYLSASEVKKMRNNHGAFYNPTSLNPYTWNGQFGGSEMVSICPIKHAFWERWEEVDGDGGAWKFYKNGSATDPSTNEPYTDGVRKMNIADTLNTVNYTISKDYMKNITKGVIDKESKYHIGIYSNCYEYVLKDKFDPVIHHRKTSLLWRMPYGRETVVPFTAINSNVSVLVRNNVITISHDDTHHAIALPLLMEYYENKIGRSTVFDGSGATDGTWTQRPLSGNFTVRMFGCRSIRTFGGSNPSYFQTITVGVGYNGSSFNTSFSAAANFDIALPVLPVFRWHKVSTSNRLILWD